MQDYLSGKYTIRGITARYGIDKGVFHMFIAAYKNFGPDILFNPPAITPEFRIRVASWHGPFKITLLTVKWLLSSAIQVLPN